MNSKKLIFFSLFFAGSLLSCDDGDPSPPSKFKTLPATDITAESAVLNGTLTLGDTEITDYGFVYSTVSNRTLSGYQTISLGAPLTNGNFNFTLEGLTPGTTYYYRAFVIGKQAGLYTHELSFTTAASATP